MHPAPSAPPASEESSNSVKGEKSSKVQQIRLSGPRGKELPKGVTAPTATTAKKITGKATAGKSSSSAKATTAKATSTKTPTAKATGVKTTTTVKAIAVAGKPPPAKAATGKAAKKKKTTKKMKKATEPTTSLPASAAQSATSASASPTGAASMMTPIRKAQCAKIISGLKRRKNKSIAWFLLPVSDKNIVQDYKAKIKHPMCISTMQNKLDKNEYRTLAQFVLDLRRIFANCLRFNTSMKDRLRTVSVELVSTAEDLLVAFLIRGQNPPLPAGAPDVYPPLLYCWSFCMKVLNTLFNLTNPSDGAPTVLYFLHPVTCYCGGQYPPDYLTLVKKPMDFGTITSK
jgi:Bromodomain